MSIERIMKDSNVQVANIASLLRVEGIMVKLHFTGGKNSYTISHKALGVKNGALSDNSKEFLSSHMGKNTVSVISKKDSNKLRAIEARTRKKLSEMATGVVFDNIYLAKETYYDFLDYFEKTKKEYLEVRDYLVDNYSSIVARFREIVLSSIDDLDAKDAVAEYDKIMSEIPSQENFKDSFNMKMSVQYFPTMTNMDDLDEAMRETLTKEYQELGENIAVSSVTNILNDIFSTVNSVYTSNKEVGKLHHKIADRIKNLVKKNREKNIFGNKKIEEFTLEVEGMLQMDYDMALEESEVLLAEVYAYSKELGLEEKINIRSCPLTRKELEDIYDLIHLI